MLASKGDETLSRNSSGHVQVGSGCGSSSSSSTSSECGGPLSVVRSSGTGIIIVEPGPNDVICARGKASFNHEGNKRFRDILNREMENYSSTRCKLEKSLFLSKIVNQVRDLGGRFVRKQETSGMWEDVGDYVAREKVGQGFRDLLDTKYRSSTKAKRRKRTKYMQDVFEKASTASCSTSFRAAEPDVPVSKVLSATLDRGEESTPHSPGNSASHSADVAPTSETDLLMERVFQQANIALLHRIKQDDAASQQNYQHQGDTVPKTTMMRSCTGVSVSSSSASSVENQDVTASARFLQDYIAQFFPNGF